MEILTGLGLKSPGANELQLEAVSNRLTVSVSPQRIRGHSRHYMLFDHLRADDIRLLGEMLALPRTGNRHHFAAME